MDTVMGGPVGAVRRRFVVDAVLVLGTVAAVGLGAVVMGAPLRWDGPFALGLALGGSLVVRRRWPVGVLVASGVAVVGFQVAGRFEGGWVWPLSVALVGAAAGRLWWAAGVAAVVLGTGVAWEWDGAGEAFARGGAEALWAALLLALVNGHSQWRRRNAERAARLRERERARLAEERLAVSRELHDVVAHTLAVVGVHLSVAVDALDDSPEEARAALRTAQEVKAKAMRDLKAMVGGLREVPPPDLGGVADLVGQARQAGLVVDLVERGDPADVPAAQAVAAHRMIQEALTNALRHSGATTVRVRIDCGADAVTVSVDDDGVGAAEVSEGHGLTGMRERVAALGGTLHVTGGRGFAVRAVLPIGGPA